MKLSIVIPAYNEESAISEIVTRCLSARETLKREAGLSDVELLVVDDGSRDRTNAIAAKFGEIKLVTHPVNRGYGAALMTGFEAASGELLSFLDADGTCDPLAFVELIRALERAQAQLSIGNRLHPGSKMPRVRELGNRVYAQIISRLSGVVVGDTASGMRVFRRELLARLAPLPSGLHFTPAMTARAACMGAKIVESPIPYAERQGQSKLNVVADGLRFLRVILGIIFAYQPLKIFGPLGAFFAAVAAAYAWQPASYYARHGEIHPDMIYRFLTILTLSVCALIAGAFGLLAQRLADLALARPAGALERAGARTAAMGAGLSLGALGVAINSRTIVEYLTTRTIQTPWIHVLLGGLCVIAGTTLVCLAIILGLINHLPQTKLVRK